MAKTCHVFVLVVMSLAACNAQFLRVEWDAVSASGGAQRVPRIEGLQPAPVRVPANKGKGGVNGSDSLFQLATEDNDEEEEDLEIETLLAAKFDEAGWAPGKSTTVTLPKQSNETILKPVKIPLEDLPLSKLRARDLVSLTRALALPCKACVERSDFVSLISSHLDSLSIGALKNFLLVRGSRCVGCKTRAHLRSAAIQVAHRLPLKLTNLILCEMESVFLFPGTTRRFLISDSRHKTLLASLLKGDAVFGLSPMPEVGVLSRVEEMTKTVDGAYSIKVRGEARFTIDEIDRSWEAQGGFPLGHVTLFTDDPLNRTAGQRLVEDSKRTRTLFFAQDSDFAAERRADSLGNPPTPDRGPELLSYWLSMALSLPPPLSRRLLVSRDTRERLDLLEPVLYQLIRARSAELGLSNEKQDEAAAAPREKKNNGKSNGKRPDRTGDPNQAADASRGSEKGGAGERNGNSKSGNGNGPPAREEGRKRRGGGGGGGGACDGGDCTE